MPAEITAVLGVGGPPTIPSDVVDRGSTAAPVRPVGGRGAALIWRQLKRAARQFTIGGVGTTLFAGATVASSYVLGWVTDKVLIPSVQAGEVDGPLLAGASLAIL